MTFVYTKPLHFLLIEFLQKQQRNLPFYSSIFANLQDQSFQKGIDLFHFYFNSYYIFLRKLFTKYVF